MEFNYKELLTGFGEFLTGLLGADTEVVLHDLETDEIIWIQNGHITGRKLGDTQQNTAITFLADQSVEGGCTHIMSGYKSNSKSGTPLRASNFFIRDKKGKLRYAICVNQDLTDYMALQKHLEAITGTISLSKLLPDTSKGRSMETVEELTMKVILEEMELAKPFSMDSKEAKLQILRRLNDRGIFEVRGAAGKICGLLHIAQPTLYKYLKQIAEE